MKGEIRDGGTAASPAFGVAGEDGQGRARTDKDAGQAGGQAGLPMEIQESEKDKPGFRVTIRIPEDLMTFLEKKVGEKMAQGHVWDVSREIRSCILLKQFMGLTVAQKRVVSNRLGIGRYSTVTEETAEQKMLFDVNSIKD